MLKPLEQHVEPGRRIPTNRPALLASGLHGYGPTTAALHECAKVSIFRDHDLEKMFGHN
jgi:hypothetical protein